MEKKITIGLFIDTYFPMIDGVINVVDNYAKELSEMANVIVFAPEVKGKEFDDSKLKYKVVRCKSLKAAFLDYSWPIPGYDSKFKKELNKYKLDIVHIHSPFMMGKQGIKYARKHNIPVIGTMHSQFKKDIKKVVKFDFIANLLNKTVIRTFNKCDECFAVNDEVAKIFFEEYGYKKMPKTINNATDMKLIEDKEESDTYVNTLYDIKNDEKMFLYVGRINSLKNIFFIVDSLKILKDKKPELKFKMLFVGKGQDEEKLIKKIKENNMQNEIKLCGKIIEKEILAKYYQREDLFLFPSLYDSSSIVQIEAASQCTPTVFLRKAATASNIQDNVDGFLSEDTPREYAEKINEVMDNKELYAKVSKNTYKNIYKNWSTTIEEVYKIYLEYIEK